MRIVQPQETAIGPFRTGVISRRRAVLSEQDKKTLRRARLLLNRIAFNFKDDEHANRIGVVIASETMSDVLSDGGVDLE